MALLIFFTYLNLTKLAEGSVSKGKIDFSMAWWPLHLIMALGIFAMFAWRLNVNHRYHPQVLWAGYKRRHFARPVCRTGVPAK